MKPQAWLLVGVRAVGLGLVIWRAPYAFGCVGLWILYLTNSRVDAWARLWDQAGPQRFYLVELAVFLQFVLGLVMLLDGKRVVRILLRGFPARPGSCPRCGYDTSGLESGRCPECGAKVAPVNSRP